MKTLFLFFYEILLRNLRLLTPPNWAEMPTMNQWKACAHSSHVFASLVDLNKHLLEYHEGERSFVDK